ncbi:MAG: hypothetical protein A3A86_04695 [Elusimicrobia bacterium RIFCSPLOWO2_01_FULL_60_11]|nr:MAG: hypothetical protein A3A86_04695 [Elusimicrobia bacterium RIFCSPLOWO2_01_FULL_60_11]
MNRTGFWAGTASLALAAVCLALGLVPLFQAFLAKPLLLKIPGQTALDLKLPGTYIGTASFVGLSPQEKKNAVNFDYWLSDESEKDFLKVNRFPARNYYSDKEESQVPLFEIIIEKKGKYVFTADYAIGAEGPAVPVVLHRYDAEHIRAELIAGSVMFLLLGGLGSFLIWKSKKR